MNKKSHVKYGLTAALVLIILFLVQWFAKIPFDHPAFSFIPRLCYAAIIFACVLNFSKLNEGNASFGELFGNGFRATAVTTVIFALFFILFLQFVPEAKTAIVDFMLTQGPNAADAQAVEESRKFVNNRFVVFVLAGIIFLNLFIGIIASLIGAAFAKKK